MKKLLFVLTLLAGALSLNSGAFALTASHLQDVNVETALVRVHHAWRHRHYPCYSGCACSCNFGPTYYGYYYGGSYYRGYGTGLFGWFF